MEKPVSWSMFPWIPSFKWEDLDGLILKIVVIKDTIEGVTTVVGLDERTGNKYIIKQEVIPEQN